MGAPPQHSRHSMRSAAGLAPTWVLVACEAAAALRRSRMSIRPATCAGQTSFTGLSLNQACRWIGEICAKDWLCNAAAALHRSRVSIRPATCGRDRHV